MHQSVVASGFPVESDVGRARLRAYEVARARWPGVELSLSQFSAHLARHGWVSELPRQTDELYLCCGCSLGNREACRRLDGEYFTALQIGLARQCGRRDLVEETMQQTRMRLLVGPEPRIASFRGNGALASWLQRVARRLVSDLYRQENKHTRLAAASRWFSVASADAAPLSDVGMSRSLDARYVGQLERSLLAAMAQLSDEERALLRLHYVQGLSVDEIAACLKRDRSNVYRRLNQIKARVKRWAMTCAREQTGISDREELSSLFQANCMGIYLDPSVWLDPGRAERG